MCFELSSDVVQKILEIMNSLFVHKEDKDKWTTLHYACFQNATANVVKLLIEYARAGTDEHWWRARLIKVGLH
jgi:ankyrin repeat protein